MLAHIAVLVVLSAVSLAVAARRLEILLRK
jgi:hypothetical protein